MVNNNFSVSPSQGSIGELGLKFQTKDLDLHQELGFKKELEKRSEDKHEATENSFRGTKKKTNRKSANQQAEQLQDRNQNANLLANSSFMDSNENEIEFTDIENNLSSANKLASTPASKLARIDENQKSYNFLKENLQDQNSSLNEIDQVNELKDQSTDENQEFKFLSDVEKQLLQEAGSHQNGNEEPSTANELLADESASNLEAVNDPMMSANVTENIDSNREPKNKFENLVLQKLNQEKSSATSSSLVRNSMIENVNAEAKNQNSSTDSQSGANSGSHFQSNTQSNNPKLDTISQLSSLHIGQGHFQSHINSANSPNSLAELNPKGTTTSMDKGEIDQNIKSIIDQAQFLVTKGGGEMNVKMTPEGMGEVHLKVMLENGQVNVEVNSQDKSIKKLIEESLGDLRTQLNAHHLQFDQIKVNTVAATDTSNQTRFDNNHQSFSNEHYQQQQNQFTNFDQRQGQQNRQEQRSLGSGVDLNSNQILRELKSTGHKVNPYLVANKGRSINMVA